MAICPHCNRETEPHARWHERGDCPSRYRVTLHVYDSPYTRGSTHEVVSVHDSESAAIAYAYRQTLRGDCSGYRIDEVPND